MGTNASNIDPVDDPNLELDDFFRKVQSSLLRKRPIPILHVRNQGPTYTCYGHVVTAVMYGDEVSRVGNSILGSRQEFLDNIHKHHRPKLAIKKFGELGPFDVPDTGFPCSYPVAFDYAVNRGVSQDIEYPWIGVPKCNTYSGTKWDGNIVVKNKPIDRKIYKGTDAGDKGENHAITLVGYGNEGDDHYYLCQNSYGLHWGYMVLQGSE